MKTLKLKHYFDDAHGWVSVNRTLLECLGLLNQVSSYSYQSKSGKVVYLEEDRDAGLLFYALNTRKLFYEVIEIHHSGRSRIRNLNNFKPK